MMATLHSLEMMGGWSFITLKMVSWWVQKPIIQSGENLVTWLPGCWVALVPGYLVTLIPGYPMIMWPKNLGNPVTMETLET